MIALCGVAAWHGVKATAKVDWPDPFELDPLRDIGIAQSMLDGRYPEDHLFLHEIQWYNPGIAALIAAGSKLSGLPTHTVAAHLGAYINVLVPLSFALFCAWVFDAWIALAALLFFLFGVTTFSSTWSTGTYSPWLLATNFALFPFFVAAICYFKGKQHGHFGWHAAAGAALALTFYFHTSAAVLLGGTVVLLTAGGAWALRHSPNPSAEIRNLVAPVAVLLAVAFCLSLPYSGPILWRYHFALKNPWPTYYTAPLMSLDALPERLKGLVSLSMVAAIWGSVLVLKQGKASLEKRFLFWWFVIAAAFVVYSYIWQVFDRRGVQLPQIVSGFHFVLWLSTLKSVLAGYGIVQGIRVGMTRLLGKKGSSPEDSAASRTSAYYASSLTVPLVLAALFGIYYPAYPKWVVLTKTYDPVQYAANFAGRAPAYQWILENTKPSDVFLCREAPSLQIVGAAGRKVLATMLFYANLYVDVQKGFLARDMLFDALAKKNRENFILLSRENSVGYILAQGDDVALVENTGFAEITPLWHSGGVRIYRVNLPPSLPNSTAGHDLSINGFSTIRQAALDLAVCWRS